MFFYYFLDPRWLTNRYLLSNVEFASFNIQGAFIYTTIVVLLTIVMEAKKIIENSKQGPRHIPLLSLSNVTVLCWYMYTVVLVDFNTEVFLLFSVISVSFHRVWLLIDNYMYCIFSLCSKKCHMYCLRLLRSDVIYRLFAQKHSYTIL